MMTNKPTKVSQHFMISPELSGVIRYHWFVSGAFQVSRCAEV